MMLSIGRQKAGQKKRDLGNKMGNIPLHKKEGLHKNKPSFFMVVRIAAHVSNECLHLSQHLLIHDIHQNEDCQQEEGEEGNMNVICNQSKYRRHETGSDVGKSHLNADQCLRTVRTKIGRCGMDDAWVNGSTSKTDQDEAD